MYERLKETIFGRTERDGYIVIHLISYCAYIEPAHPLKSLSRTLQEKVGRNAGWR